MKNKEKLGVKLTKSSKCQPRRIAFWGYPYVDILPTSKRALSASCGLSGAFTGDTLPRHRQRDSPGTASRRVSPSQRLCDALRAQERRRGAEMPPKRTQRGTGGVERPAQPHSGTGAGTGAEAAHSPQDTPRGADRHRDTTQGGTLRRPRREPQNAPQRPHRPPEQPHSTKRAKQHGITPFRKKCAEVQKGGCKMG